MKRGDAHDGAGRRRDPLGHDPLGHEPLGHDGRPFPDEREWLTLDVPPAEQRQLASAGAFAERVLDTLRAERELDRQLQRLDDELPAGILADFEAPEPSPDFVASTLAAARRDRGDRWRRLLARYVAPEPSAAFVSQTLRALARTEDADAPTTRRAAGRLTALRPAAWLVAAAAVVALWFALAPRQGADDAPLELRLARSAPPDAAWADAPTPLSAVLTRAAEQSEPFVVFAGPTDGLWLATAAGGAR